MTISTRKLLALSLGAGLLLFACRSLGTPEDQLQSDGLWEQMEGYQSWGAFEGHAGVQPGKGHESDYVRTFVNSILAADPSAPAYGSIIVKENLKTKDPASLIATTVMLRIEGYDPDSEDWFWARYDADGEPTHSGKVGFCADCHFDAEGDDFVFLND